MPRLDDARPRERRLILPDSPQNGACRISDLTLRTSTGISRNLCGLIVSGIETSLTQAGTTHADYWRVVHHVGPLPVELLMEVVAMTHPYRCTIGEVVGLMSTALEPPDMPGNKYPETNFQSGQHGIGTHLPNL